MCKCTVSSSSGEVSATTVEVNGRDVALDLAALNQRRLHIIIKVATTFLV